MKSEWRPVFVIFVSLIVDLLGFTVILPLLPSMLEYYSKTDETGLYNSTLNFVDTFRELIKAPADMQRLNIVLFGGFIGSLYSLLQFFSSPIIGASSDIYGRKPILILSTIGVLLSYILWSISYDFPLFIISRVLAGLSKGIVSISTALVTDVTTSADRPSAMALIGVAFSVGFIFGPLIGAYFSYFGRSVEAVQHSFVIFQYPAIFSCLTSSLVVVILIFFLKETLPPIKRAKSLGAGLNAATSLINPISLFRYSAVSKISKSDLSNLRWMSFAYFLYLLLFAGLEQTLTFLVYQRFQYTRMQQGKMFLAMGLMMALVQGGYLRRKRAGTEKTTALIGMIVIIPGMLLIGWSSNQIMLYFGLVLYSFGAGTVVSCMTTIASRFGKEDEKGKIMGIFRSLGALSRALGPFLACAIYWSYGACICYMVGGLSIIIPVFILARVQIASLKAD